jgi:hypothetical protein
MMGWLGRVRSKPRLLAVVVAVAVVLAFTPVSPLLAIAIIVAAGMLLPL